MPVMPGAGIGKCAELGRIRASARHTAIMTDNGPGSGTFPSGMFSEASITDTRIVGDGPATGFIEVDYVITGSLSVDTQAGVAQSDGFRAFPGSVLATASFNVRPGPNGGVGATPFNDTVLFSASDFPDGPYPAGTRFTDSRTIQEALTVRYPYSSGRVFIENRLVTATNCAFFAGLDNRGANCAAAASLGNSVTVVGAKVLDVNLVEVDGATVNSNAGFDYIDGFDDREEVSVASSCLGGSGRVDLNIVNTGNNPSVYRFELQGQSARAVSVDPDDWARISITGRPPGNYTVVVKKDGTQVVAETIPIDCSFDVQDRPVSSPEVRILNACRAGNGYILFQFVNPTIQFKPYVINFDSVPNRSTTAQPFGQQVRATTGRPDGVHSYTVRSGADVVESGEVLVNCD